MVTSMGMGPAAAYIAKLTTSRIIWVLWLELTNLLIML